MHGEFPTFKRCCCCLPLRYGLLFWGYLMLALSLLIIYPMIRAAIECFTYPIDDGSRALLVIRCILNVSDIIFNLFFIVEAHKKNHKLINVYCYYMMVVTVIHVLLFIGILTVNINSYGIHLNMIKIIVTYEFCYVVVQGYVILLARSEVAKLRDNCQFNFTNVGAEAECALRLRTHDNDHASTQPTQQI